VERALRARFGLWILSRDTSGLSPFNFFTAIMAPRATRRDEIGCAKLAYFIYRDHELQLYFRRVFHAALRRHAQ
jgi:hypothetical protein